MGIDDQRESFSLNLGFLNKKDDDGRVSAGGATPARIRELIEENKRLLKALSQRYPGQLELRAPLGATPSSLRMQAQTAARFEDILAHVTLTGAGSRDSRLLPIWDQTRVWDPGDEPPLKRAGACGRPPNTPAAAKPPLAVREGGGVVWSSDGAPFAHPVSCLLEALCVL